MEVVTLLSGSHTLLIVAVVDGITGPHPSPNSHVWLHTLVHHLSWRAKRCEGVVFIWHHRAEKDNFVVSNIRRPCPCSGRIAHCLVVIFGRREGYGSKPKQKIRSGVPKVVILIATPATKLVLCSPLDHTGEVERGILTLGSLGSPYTLPCSGLCTGEVTPVPLFTVIGTTREAAVMSYKPNLIGKYWIKFLFK